MTPRRSLVILGTRGIPAAHGGFETFAEHLSLYLVKQGWDVAVYCQHQAKSAPRKCWSDVWNGVERLNIDVARTGPFGTLEFDLRCVIDAAERDSLCLVLGYNSAVLLPYLRLKGRTVLTNMDGLEWRRPKWSRPVRAWFWLNEWIAAWSSDRLIADHPVIADHLSTRRSRDAIVMIPYGGLPVETAAPDPLAPFGLEPDRYLVSIARIEPDNNILPIVEAFSRQPRGMKLAVLGTFDDAVAYHRAIKAAASSEVVFPGAIYDADTIRAVRFHAKAYVHGHSVGGTNPSLVEALWAGSAVLAHDNPFNRWTAGPEQFYFADGPAFERMIDAIATDEAAVGQARVAARLRAGRMFDWSTVLRAYEREMSAALRPKLRTAAVARSSKVQS